MLFVAEHNAPMEASVQHLNDYSGLIILVMKILALYAGSPDWTIAMIGHKSCDAGDSIVAPYHLLGVRGCNSSPWLQFMEVREDGYIWHDTLATLLKVSRAESILTCIRVWQRGDLSIMKRAGVRGSEMLAEAEVNRGLTSRDSGMDSVITVVFLRIWR